MAHPIIEAIYIGLFASTVGQPVDVPKEPVAQATAPACVECRMTTSRAPRVVYNWAAGTRSVYRAPRKPVLDETPMVGMSELQMRRISGLAAG